MVKLRMTSGEKRRQKRLRREHKRSLSVASADSTVSTASSADSNVSSEESKVATTTDTKVATAEDVKDESKVEEIQAEFKERADSDVSPTTEDAKDAEPSKVSIMVPKEEANNKDIDFVDEVTEFDGDLSYQAELFQAEILGTKEERSEVKAQIVETSIKEADTRSPTSISTAPMVDPREEDSDTHSPITSQDTKENSETSTKSESPVKCSGSPMKGSESPVSTQSPPHTPVANENTDTKSLEEKDVKKATEEKDVTTTEGAAERDVKTSEKEAKPVSNTEDAYIVLPTIAANRLVSTDSLTDSEKESVDSISNADKKELLHRAGRVRNIISEWRDPAIVSRETTSSTEGDAYKDIIDDIEPEVLIEPLAFANIFGPSTIPNSKKKKEKKKEKKDFILYNDTSASAKMDTRSFVDDMLYRLLDAGLGPRSKDHILRPKSGCVPQNLMQQSLFKAHDKFNRLFTLPEVNRLIKIAQNIIADQPMYLELHAPINIVGDIHGQYRDLLSHFEANGFPPNSNYLFLGDYVDRGCQQLETILLMLCYKIKYPENFFMLRGNHECSLISRIYGFFDECKRRLGVKIWKEFCGLFNYLPVAAIVEEKIFCCHGGLSPDFFDDPANKKIGKRNRANSMENAVENIPMGFKLNAKPEHPNPDAKIEQRLGELVERETYQKQQEAAQHAAEKAQIVEPVGKEETTIKGEIIVNTDAISTCASSNDEKKVDKKERKMKRRKSEFSAWSNDELVTKIRRVMVRSKSVPNARADWLKLALGSTPSSSSSSTATPEGMEKKTEEKKDGNTLVEKKTKKLSETESETSENVKKEEETSETEKPETETSQKTCGSSECEKKTEGDKSAEIATEGEKKNETSVSKKGYSDLTKADVSPHASILWNKHLNRSETVINAKLAELNRDGKLDSVIRHARSMSIPNPDLVPAWKNSIAPTSHPDQNWILDQDEDWLRKNIDWTSVRPKNWSAADRLRARMQGKLPQRPVEPPDMGLMCDLLWSDPCPMVQGWGKNERGVSFTFGKHVLAEFQKQYEIDVVVRAHQAVQQGYNFFSNKRLVTIFSAPNYCGEMNNDAGVLQVGKNLQCSLKILKSKEQRLKQARPPRIADVDQLMKGNLVWTENDVRKRDKPEDKGCEKQKKKQKFQ